MGHRKLDDLTDEETMWLSDARAMNLNATQAAAKYPRSKSWFIRRGVAGYPGRTPRIDPAQARALHDEGLTWAEVGERLGCSARGASSAALR